MLSVFQRHKARLFKLCPQLLTGRAHIVRAALEAIAYQSADLVGAMSTDCGPVIRFVLTMNTPSSTRISPVNSAILTDDIIHPRPRLRNIAGPSAKSAQASLNGLVCGSASGLSTVTESVSSETGSV